MLRILSQRNVLSKENIHRRSMSNAVQAKSLFHIQGTTLPPSDPFWDKYYPPLGWNCRCTVVQVRRGKCQESDSAKACELGESCTANTLSFRFNPDKAKIAFPDGVSYLKHADESTQHKVIAIARANNRANYEEINKVIEYDNTTITILIKSQCMKFQRVERLINHISINRKFYYTLKIT